ncbi:TetR/AcrR family transcriptional regulator [Hoyosella altamirensis]|uniref:DNA-binding transcriptional regulator YbjK n=1 Tax=Hoyosella altamirensis TaxID=616997 RepID=A0A839RMW8_9ACTN|nr:TetR family transcriptional regulator [Hoyosella altamirensis]MBB3037416.1 DNA-binding transcriptional regulator YbjK [Hoyosella altamirensis]
MTSTRKGERRRQALIEAAAELMREGGLEAVRHRGVAQRAGLPLASTTYYFASLDDLVVSAAEFEAADAMNRVDVLLAGVPRRARSIHTLTDLLVDVLVGRRVGADALASRYEQNLAIARHPELREIQVRMRAHTIAAISEVLARSGRPVSEARARALEAMVAGAVLGAVLDEPPDLAGTVRSLLFDVIDQLAPPG